MTLGPTWDVALRRARHEPLAHLPDELRANPSEPARIFSPGEVIEEEGEQGRTLRTLLSGWAAEGRTLQDGRRQIVRLVLPGDHCGISGGVGRPALCQLFALTRVRLLDHGPVLEWMGRPSVAEHLSRCTADLQKAMFEHLLRLGIMAAEQRTAHLLLETYQRLAAVGLAHEGSMELPITQMVFADTLGLSTIHVNRVLQSLKRSGLIQMGRGRASVTNMRGLASKCGFDLSFLEPYPGLARGPRLSPSSPPLQSQVAGSRPTGESVR